MTTDQLSSWLRGEIAEFVSVVDGLDPAARVPTCPEWQVRDLVGHIGQGFRWAGELVRGGSAVPVPDPKRADPGPPSAWRGWLVDGVGELIEAVERRGEEPVWTFLGPGAARFWLRRLLHDLVVHHFDAANVAGRDYLVAPELAADTICEGLELITAPEAVAWVPGLAGLRGDGRRLAVRPTDGQAGWLITREPVGARWEREEVGAVGAGAGVRGLAGVDVVLAGRTRDVLLVLTRRLDPGDGRVSVTGDRALLADWLAHVAY
ncbi:maleylpyruvate isomerase family mycothiol-dependent enzyme [Crossiella sp. CA-258035]|uniref:maleylpyruvate isomerase family mycothiol-dependent enzyme n=1 Tax=Crossiella sp. CA-258035 TaxID=2981138 RepID=UPI0024BC0589|nr:maleylpyruvate isomerase family mycothiol-dependent enzyme [Crossiella sp. CA-258035]WHT17416.1 maleylpyruvate isomerase family mycothiol-dependent enzyme [Crossiella sp. CA-258035]